MKRLLKLAASLAIYFGLIWYINTEYQSAGLPRWADYLIALALALSAVSFLIQGAKGLRELNDWTAETFGF